MCPAVLSVRFLSREAVLKQAHRLERLQHLSLIDLLKIVLTPFVAGCQSPARAKSVRCLPQEFHLTLFPQSKPSTKVCSHNQLINQWFLL